MRRLDFAAKGPSRTAADREAPTFGGPGRGPRFEAVTIILKTEGLDPDALVAAVQALLRAAGAASSQDDEARRANRG